MQKTIVDVLIAGSTLSFHDTPTHAHQAEVRFIVAAYDTNANRLTYVDKSITLILPDDKYRWMMAHAVPVRLALDLPNGRQVLRITTHDHASDKVGSLEIPVIVPTRDL